jgi:hypothetical protein
MRRKFNYILLNPLFKDLVVKPKTIVYFIAEQFLNMDACT